MNKRQRETISYIFAAASGLANIYFLGPIVSKEGGGCISLVFGTLATGVLAKVVASRMLQRFNRD